MRALAFLAIVVVLAGDDALAQEMRNAPVSTAKDTAPALNGIQAPALRHRRVAPGIP